MAHLARTALDQALDALSRDDGAAALEALLRAWREWPSTRLADLIDVVSKQCPSPPLTSTGVKALQAEWLERAANHRPIDVRALLEAPWPLHPRAAKARFAAWEKMPADPRVLRFGRELLKAGRYSSNEGLRLHKWWCEAALKVRDPEAGAALAAMPQVSVTEYYIYDEQRLAVQVAEPLRRKYPKLPRPPEEPPELAEVLAKLEGKAGRRSTSSTTVGRAELFGAVYAKPADDGARLVLADWLAEQGDPRGEFIQLQIRDARGEAKAKDRKRAAALARAGGATWLDGLEVDVLWQSLPKPVFARGFASQVTLHPRAPRTVRHPGWATIELIRLGDATVEALFAEADLKSLREVHGTGVAGLEALAARGYLLRQVTLVNRELQSVRASPEIERLRAVAERPLADVLAWAKASPFWPGLKGFECRADGGMESLLHLAAQVPAGLTRVGVYGHLDSPDHGTWELALSRDAAGAFSQLRAEYWGGRDGAGTLGTSLESLPDDALTSFELVEEWEPLPEPELSQLKRALARQKRLSRSPWF